MTESDQVTFREFTAGLQKMENNLSLKIDRITDGVNKNATAIEVLTANQTQLVKGMAANDSDIEALKNKDRGVLALASTIGATLGAVTATVIDYLKR